MKNIMKTMLGWYRRSLIWLLLRTFKSRRAPVTRSIGQWFADGENPCQLQIDALDEAANQVDTAIQLLQDRAIALMECQMRTATEVVPEDIVPAIEMMQEISGYVVNT
jgi:hypothetical protein